MAHQLSGLSSQRGASVTSVILLIIGIVIAGKLLVAIVPAHIGDYQLSKTLANQLKEANDKNETAKQFVERVDRQLAIDLNDGSSAKDLFTFKNNKTGQLAIYKKYEKTNNFFNNVYIVSRFEGDITASSAK